MTNTIILQGVTTTGTYEEFGIQLDGPWSNTTQVVCYPEDADLKSSIQRQLLDIATANRRVFIKGHWDYLTDRCCVESLMVVKDPRSPGAILP